MARGIRGGRRSWGKGDPGGRSPGWGGGEIPGRTDYPEGRRSRGDDPGRTAVRPISPWHIPGPSPGEKSGSPNPQPRHPGTGSPPFPFPGLTANAVLSTEGAAPGPAALRSRRDAVDAQPPGVFNARLDGTLSKVLVPCSAHNKLAIRLSLAYIYLFMLAVTGQITVILSHKTLL